MSNKDDKPEARNETAGNSKPDLKPVAPSLKGSIRRARIEEAERADVVAELRGAELARLEMLAEALEGVFAQVPEDVDLFDAGVVPGERPRLFIDMIGFVEMAEDKRTYRFVQDTRYGRVTIAESERQETMIDAVTDYVARRLIEREQALATDNASARIAGGLEAGAEGRGNRRRVRQAPDRVQRLVTIPESSAANGGSKAHEKGNGNASGKDASASGNGQSGSSAQAAVLPRSTDGPQAPARRGFWARMWEAVEFLALFLGFIVLLIAIAGAAYFAWNMGEGWWISKFFRAG